MESILGIQNHEMSRVFFDPIQTKVDDSVFESVMIDQKDLYEDIKL